MRRLETFLHPFPLSASLAQGWLAVLKERLSLARRRRKGQEEEKRPHGLEPQQLQEDDRQRREAHGGPDREAAAQCARVRGGAISDMISQICLRTEINLDFPAKDVLL